MNTTYVNDFDETITLCKYCEEFVNESITDDRELFIKTTVSNNPCTECGELS